MIEKSNPPGLHQPPGYHHIVTVQPTAMVYLAGQCPLDADGRLCGEDNLLEQVDQVLLNLATALTAAGTTPRNVVRTVVYVVTPERDELAAVWVRLRGSELAEAFSSASTLLGVTQLGFPGQLVEIEATAALVR
jgi:enamine deaminase RidA (YjgF/YER057c/UK114 family)